MEQEQAVLLVAPWAEVKYGGIRRIFPKYGWFIVTDHSLALLKNSEKLSEKDVSFWWQIFTKTKTFKGISDYTIDDFRKDIRGGGNLRFPFQHLTKVYEERKNYGTFLKIEIEQVEGIKKYTIGLVEEFQEGELGELQRTPTKYRIVNWGSLIEFIETMRKSYQT